MARARDGNTSVAMSPRRSLYDVRTYEPGAWKANTPAQLPVVWADRFDQFWGAKLLIRFTREQLAAAVAAARFTDPRAAP